MKFLQKITLLCLIFGVGFFGVFPANAALNRAFYTYQQAKEGNFSYFHMLKRYRNAIDITDENGNTAYCYALRDGNKQAINFLAAYGANRNHACVKRLQEQKAAQKQRQLRNTQKYYGGERIANNDNTYLWAGIGALAVGGGIALAASGSSGGSSHKKKSDNKNPPSGGDDPSQGGDNPPSGGDDPSQGGENPPSGGDDPSQGGDNPPSGGDDPSQGGDNPPSGGDDPSQGGDNPPSGGDDPTGDEVTAQTFKTDEYLKSNFLDSIKAAEAYSHMYKRDVTGKLVSHQAGSDDELKKIKVGILDSGVYVNNDLSGKVKKRYDQNRYSNDNSVWAWATESGNVQAYVVKKDSKYYLFHVHHEWSDKYNSYIDVFEPIWYGDDGFYHIGVNESQLNSTLDWGVDESMVNTLLNGGFGITLDKMTLVNAGSGFPGIDTTDLDPDAIVKKLMNSWPAVVGYLGHGTHVAGIIAANKNDSGMHGVAFENAEILATSWDLHAGTSVYNAVKKMVDDGAVVLNHSWGSGVGLNEVEDEDLTRDGYKANVSSVWNAYVYGAKKGAVWVQATGNDSRDQPDYYAGMGKIDLSKDGYKKSATEVPYIAVAALDPSTKTNKAKEGQLAWYSNACGDASDYCLAAPGDEILSTAPTSSGNVYMSGTSMATPVVTGSIALLNGYYPWLKAQNVAYLLLETANKQGDYSKKELYGQGVLDLEAAVTTPLGDLRLAKNSSFDSLTSARGSKLSVSRPLEKQMLKAMPKTVTAFDILDRPFQYDTSKLINTTHASNANLRNAVSKMALAGAKKTIKDEKSGFQFTTEETMNKGGLANLSSAEVVSETDSASSRLYYAANSKYASSDNILKSSYNPYLSMNEAYGAENTMKLSDSSKLKFSLQTGKNGLYERDYEQDRHSFNDRAYALSGEYSFNMTDFLEIATLGGMLFEDDAMLGMNGRGVLGIKDSATYYMGVKTKLNLTPDFSILAAYYRGYTKGGDAAMLSISDLETESFMLAGEYMLSKKDKVGLSFSSPLSVVKGRSSIMYASGRDNYSDTIYLKKFSSSLKPEAKEYDLGMYYQGEPTEDVSLLGKIEARFNADGEKGLTDYIGIVGAGVAF